MLGTRGQSTATLEKAAKAAAQAAEARSTQAAIEGEEEEELADEHIDDLPFEDDAQAEAGLARATEVTRALEEQMAATLDDTTTKLAAIKAKFRDTLQKHVRSMETRGLESNLSARVHQMAPARANSSNEAAATAARSHDTGVASAAAAVRAKSTSKRLVRVMGSSSPTRATEVTPAADGTAAPSSFSSPPRAQLRPKLSQTARLNHSPVVVSSPISSSTAAASSSSSSSPSVVPPLDRPWTARPASASRNTPRQRLEQAKMFSDSVYGSRSTTAGKLDFDHTRDELTGAVLPAALTKQRATSAPYKPQHSKPSFTQPAHRLAPIGSAAQAMHTNHALDQSRPSSSASTSSHSSFASTGSLGPTTATGTKRSQGSSKKKPIATASTAAVAASASATSALFASPFGHIKPVPVVNATAATKTATSAKTTSAKTASTAGTTTTAATTTATSTAAVAAAAATPEPAASTTSASTTTTTIPRTAAAVSASERAAAVIAATKAALAAAKEPSAILKPSSSTKTLPTTRGVSITPTPPPASRPVQPTPKPAPAKPVLTAAQAVRQQLVAAQVAHAASQPLEEIDLTGDEDDADETDLEGIAHDDGAANDDDVDASSLFARPWSAHARAEHSALNSARSRPQSAARVRPSEHADERPYASFSIPVHDPSLVAQLQSQIHVSSTYARAFAQQQQQRQQQQQQSTGAPPSNASHVLTAAAPTAHTGAATPRGSLPVTHNPFLLKTTVFSGR